MIRSISSEEGFSLSDDFFLGEGEGGDGRGGKSFTFFAMASHSALSVHPKPEDEP